ncbi:hypothetical protein MRX96_017893 [Rhipicephalus microplus]
MTTQKMILEIVIEMTLDRTKKMTVFQDDLLDEAGEELILRLTRKMIQKAFLGIGAPGRGKGGDIPGDDSEDVLRLDPGLRRGRGNSSTDEEDDLEGIPGTGP